MSRSRPGRVLAAVRRLRATGTQAPPGREVRDEEPSRWALVDGSVWLAVGALALPVLVVPTVLVREVSRLGGAVLLTVGPAVVLGSLGCLVAAGTLLATPYPSRARVGTVVWAVAGQAVGLIAWAGLAVPRNDADFSRDGLWWYGFGAVVLSAALLGVLESTVVVLLVTGAELAVATSGGGGLTAAVYPVVTSRLFHLVVAVPVVVLVRELVRRGVELGRLEGHRHGRSVERQRLRRAMHDTVLQTLEAIAAETPGPGSDAERLAELRGRARRQARELRHFLDGDTDPGEHDAHVVADLRRLAEEFAERGLDVELNELGVGIVVLPAERAQALRGVVREALTNVVKHARASRAVVLARITGNRLTVSIRDHGVGFDARAAEDGFGLQQSIRSRAVDAGGSCSVRSRPGWGTWVTVEFPLSRRDRPQPRWAPRWDLERAR